MRQAALHGSLPKPSCLPDFPMFTCGQFPTTQDNPPLSFLFPFCHLFPQIFLLLISVTSPSWALLIISSPGLYIYTCEVSLALSWPTSSPFPLVFWQLISPTVAEFLQNNVYVVFYGLRNKEHYLLLICFSCSTSPHFSMKPLHTRYAVALRSEWGKTYASSLLPLKVQEFEASRDRETSIRLQL